MRAHHLKARGQEQMRSGGRQAPYSMAESDGDPDNSSVFSKLPRRKKKGDDDDEDDDEEAIPAVLGMAMGRKNVCTTAAGNEMPKREENPFSFKHFLKRDAGNYHNTGARPKVYTNLTSENFDNIGTEASDSDNLYARSTTPRHVATPELTSVLPDFVQDHLVVEQCYLSHSEGSLSPQLAVDLENLPDFAINNISAVQESTCGNKSGSKARQWDEPKKINSDIMPKDIPFDLTGTTSDQIFSRRVRKNSGPTPLDLPNIDRVPAETSRLGTSGGLPFDLPLVGEVSDGASNSAAGVAAARSGPPLGEVGVSKSLPDFLSDGPIHSGRHTDVELSDNCELNSSLSRNQTVDDNAQRFLIENERLRRELDIARRQSAEQARRIQVLEKELCTMQSKEKEETATLEKAIEQVEDNLKRSTRRAVTAESQVSKLRQEVKLLMSELSQLRRENRELRSGQCPSGIPTPNQEQQTQRLSHELRAASDSAEMSLRQLLSGVGNLRVIASTLENMYRIHDRTGDFLSDVDDDNTGPAL